MSTELQHISPVERQSVRSRRGLAAYVESNPDMVESRPRTGRPREREKQAQRERQRAQERALQAQRAHAHVPAPANVHVRPNAQEPQPQHASTKQAAQKCSHAHELQGEDAHKYTIAREHEPHQQTSAPVRFISSACTSNRKSNLQRKRRRVRWEVLFAGGVVAILVATFGAGGVIAAQRSYDALNYQELAAKGAVEAAEVAEVAEVKEAASVSSETAAPDSSTHGAFGKEVNDAVSAAAANEAEQGALAARNAAFEVDPSNTMWNYSQSTRKVVYLTIDDGPSANTQVILDILDRYQCKATFFVTGYHRDYFPWIAEAYKRGHTIGMHTFSHDYAQIYSSDEAFFQDLAQICDVVKQQIGYVPCFIRFPGGSSNKISANYNPGIMSRLAAEVQARGFQYYDWNKSFGDGDDHTAEELMSYACAPTDATNIVMLCHDAPAKQTTLEALPAVIGHYQNLGYTFEALTRESFVPHHDIAN